ncbi:MAG TPA: hypothetical protein VGK89_05920 [Candidatus Eisenbacteria bacterium]|jgi:hypothetical protein
MDAHDPVSKLQKVADYRTVRKSLKRSGGWSVLFGAIAIWAGVGALPVDWVITVLGVVLVGTGVWNIAAPRPTGIILDGVTLLLVGGYNLIGTVLSAMDGVHVSPRWALVGILQLFWGLQRIQSFRRFANAFLERPSDTAMQQIEETVATIRKAKAKESTDIIEFAVDGIHRHVWKARLVGEQAVFVEATGSDILVGTRGSVEITSRGKVMVGSALKADAMVGTQRLRGRISEDSFRRYEQWKTGTFVPKPIAA